MRERAFVHVAGPPGCGKTMLIESLLGSVGGFIIAARCIRDDKLRNARESAPKAHPELRRYRDAGASGAALFVFPGSDIGSDAFFMTELMEDYSQGVILEGDNPLEWVDLTVFVAPPPTAGERLFELHRRDAALEQSLKVDAIERILSEPDGIVKLLGNVMGDPIVEFARKTPKLLEDARAMLIEGVETARRAPPPKPTRHWTIHDRYIGIEHAQLVVVNVLHDSEREAAAELVADVVRLRKEEQLFKDILGFRGSRVPITAVIANLAQPDDPGRKKALMRVQRAFRPRT